MKYLLVGILVAFILSFAVILWVDLFRNRAKIGAEPGSPLLLSVMGPLILFFACMGISDYVMNTIFFRKFALVENKRLPGTLISAATLPLSIVAIAYLFSADVDMKIVVVPMLFHSIGAVLGVWLLADMSGDKIGKFIGVAMLISAVFLSLRLFGVGGDGGALRSFPVYKLVICGVCSLLLGAGSMIGLGCKAPYLSLFLLLGLSADCVLAAIMPACTMGALSGGVQYVRRGLYQRKIALIYSTVGFVGVAAGFLFVMNLPQTILQAVMLCITFYTGISMLRKKTDRKQETFA